MQNNSANKDLKLVLLSANSTTMPKTEITNGLAQLEAMLG